MDMPKYNVYNSHQQISQFIHFVLNLHNALKLLHICIKHMCGQMQQINATWMELIETHFPCRVFYRTTLSFKAIKSFKKQQILKNGLILSLKLLKILFRLYHKQELIDIFKK